MTLTMGDQNETADAGADAGTKVLGRISVGPPYFDLRDVVDVGNGVVTASVPINPPTQPETGLVAAAQVARHLAILGSCAVALQRDDDCRHHYLATGAHFLRTANEIDVVQAMDLIEACGPNRIRAEAIGTWIDRRTARAFVKLLGIDCQSMHVLDVQYTVLTPRMFGRLQPTFEPSTLNGSDLGLETAEGQADDAMPFEVYDTERGVQVDCGTIPVSMCEGHFPDYPAAPVALVMGHLARAAGIAMNRHLGFGELNYQVDEARVVATKLGRAGQRLILNARYGRRVGGGHLMIGTAEADGEVIGELELTLSTTSLPEVIPFPINALA